MWFNAFLSSAAYSRSRHALTGCSLSLVGRLWSLLVQLLLETGEHLEELALKGKLSLEFVGPLTGELVENGCASPTLMRTSG